MQTARPTLKPKSYLASLFLLWSSLSPLAGCEDAESGAVDAVSAPPASPGSGSDTGAPGVPTGGSRGSSSGAAPSGGLWPTSPPGTGTQAGSSQGTGSTTGNQGPDSTARAAQGDTPVTLVASGPASVEAFVNGTPVGASGQGQALSIDTVLRAGERNVVALRVTRGGDSSVHAQLAGSFGTIGTNAQWQVKAASGAERTDQGGRWTEPGDPGFGWQPATNVAAQAPSGLPEGSPAEGVWTHRSSDDVILLRLALYLPEDPASLSTARGFGRATTGGQGGEVVRVSTPQALARAVGGSTRRIIEVVGTIDFTGTEGSASTNVCYQMQCRAPAESEVREARQPGDCSGKPTFRFSYDRAGVTPLAVGSNKTIIGVGADAAIRGKGLSLRNGSRNVIIRNLAITDINAQMIWGGDALTLDGADSVWVDHVRFARVGRQMLVTGFGKASNVTLSWNEFDGVTPYAAYCDGRHYWVWLLLGGQDTITLSNNWVHHTSGRAPHAGGMNNATVTAHIVNNLFDQIAGHAADPDTALTRLFLEANYFRDVDRPIDIDPLARSNVFAPIASLSGDRQNRCMQALGRPCVSNVASPQRGQFPNDPRLLTSPGFRNPQAIVAPYPAEEVPYVVPHLSGPGHLPKAR